MYTVTYTVKSMLQTSDLDWWTSSETWWHKELWCCHSQDSSCDCSVDVHWRTPNRFLLHNLTFIYISWQCKLKTFTHLVWQKKRKKKNLTPQTQCHYLRMLWHIPFRSITACIMVSFPLWVMALERERWGRNLWPQSIGWQVTLSLLLKIRNYRKVICGDGSAFLRLQHARKGLHVIKRCNTVFSNTSPKYHTGLALDWVCLTFYFKSETPTYTR